MSKRKSKGTALTTVDTTPQVQAVTKQLGQTIMAAVKAEKREDYSKQCIRRARILTEQEELLQRSISRDKKRLSIVSRQIAAIKEGKFTLDVLTGEFVFQEEEINISWDEMAQWRGDIPPDYSDALLSEDTTQKADA